MATISLDQLKADVEKNYATLTIEIGADDKIDLRNLLRVERNARGKITDKLDEIDKLQDDESLSQTAMLTEITKIAREVLALAAGKRGKDLMSVVGDDDGLIMEILTQWTGETQVGEAEHSSE